MRLLYRLILTWLIAIGVVLVVPITVRASADDLTPVGPDSQAVDTVLFELSPFVVSFIFGALVPLVTGVLTKLNTPSVWKSRIMLLLDAAVGLVTVAMVEGGGAVFSQSAVVAAILAFFASSTTYDRVWKPHQVTSSHVVVTNDDGQKVEVPGRLAVVGVK